LKENLTGSARRYWTARLMSTSASSCVSIRVRSLKLRNSVTLTTVRWSIGQGSRMLKPPAVVLTYLPKRKMTERSAAPFR